MPIRRCTADGKPGYKWGEGGKCYTGPGARAKARRQGVAVEISRGRFKVHNKGLFDTFEERVIDDGVTVIFAKYKALDRWTTQEVQFDEEKFDVEHMIVWLEEHNHLPIDVCLEEWNPEEEKDPLVQLAMVDELVANLTETKDKLTSEIDEVVLELSKCINPGLDNETLPAVVRLARKRLAELSPN